MQQDPEQITHEDKEDEADSEPAVANNAVPFTSDEVINLSDDEQQPQEATSSSVIDVDQGSKMEPI